MMMTRERWLSAVALVALAAGCGGDLSTTAFDPHTLSESAGWGQGLEGFGSTGGTGGVDSGGTGGGGANPYDGTWEGTYSLTTELVDFSATCSCSAAVTLVFIDGDMQVGFGENCVLDCGINSQLSFEGGVGADGVAAGTVSEDSSFFFTVPWTGSFTADQGSGSFSEAGLSTNQGNTNVSGSFSVLPAAR